MFYSILHQILRLITDVNFVLHTETKHSYGK